MATFGPLYGASCDFCFRKAPCNGPRRAQRACEGAAWRVGGPASDRGRAPVSGVSTSGRRGRACSARDRGRAPVSRLKRSASVAGVDPPAKEVAVKRLSIVLGVVLA